jgi:curved DNA-binding protein CbpA/tRNA A-37 threonylcarbamoyl transferase component Bud32
MTQETDDLDERLLIEALARALGDRYQFVSRLGGGAFGEVYRVHDTMLERDVAVKRVRLDAFAEPAQRNELRERTIREAKVAAKLKHPNIVTIYDVVDRPDMSFIIMEYIEGITLARILKDQGRLSVKETLRILDQTASALDFAHKKGVVHRDIKPANIMVEASDREVKVTDFGIAKSDSFTELTAAGSVLGTPNYMSPEQARGESAIDYRADLFSLGCVLYECLVGKKAFAGKNVMATLMSIMNESPRSFDPGALGLHAGIGDLLKRGLAKDAGERYSTAGEFVDALRSLPPCDPDTVLVQAPAPAAAPVVTRREPGNTSSFDARLQGSLAATTVAGLIREVYSSRNTGILHFEWEGVGKRIYFKQGSIVFANSDVNEDRLGEFLIRMGRIDRATFDRVSATMQKTGSRFGATLVELGVVERAELRDLVRRQVQEIIYSVFEWKSGNYAFEFLDRPVEEDIIVELSTAELILIGVRRISSLDHVRTALGTLDCVLRHTENPLLLYQKMTLTTSEGYVLSRVDDATSISEIAAISPLGEDETLRCVYALVAAGVVELASKEMPASAPRVRVSPTSEERFPAPELQSEEKAEAPAAPVSASEEPGERERAVLADIAAMHESLEGADYYELLGVSPGASDDDIKRGYYAMARKYHPDRHHLPHMREVQGLLEAIFAKVTAAYEELSDPGSRRRYDGARHQKARATAETNRETATATPVSYTVPPEVIAERHYQQGYSHFERTEYFDAIQCLRESVRMMPGEARYHKLLARALSRNPKWRKEAEQHFLVALKADEFDIECLLGLAENYENENLKIRATKLYEKILAYDPDNEIALEKLKASRKKSRR